MSAMIRLRKTSFVRALFGEEFTRSQLPDLAGKDASIALAGFWGVALSLAPARPCPTPLEPSRGRPAIFRQEAST
jgi:hypothetical protein